LNRRGKPTAFPRRKAPLVDLAQCFFDSPSRIAGFTRC
jgi:hypothetical protein